MWRSSCPQWGARCATRCGRPSGCSPGSHCLPPISPGTPQWLADWQAADRVAAEVVAAELAGTGSLTGSAVAAQVWNRAPDDALLLVAASWPVRQVEMVAGRRDGLRVIGNRGANGIDGLVSTAWGAALAHQALGGGPALALMGDLAFLHDHNGLLVGADEPRPDLVIVVTDNDGGGIFHQLEQGRPEHAGSFERVFGTALGGTSWRSRRRRGCPRSPWPTWPGWIRRSPRAMSAGGVHVVVAHVPDRAAEAQLMAAVRSAVADRLSVGGRGGRDAPRDQGPTVQPLDFILLIPPPSRTVRPAARIVPAAREDRLPLWQYTR